MKPLINILIGIISIPLMMVAVPLIVLIVCLHDAGERTIKHLKDLT